ncbi:MAG: Hydrolase 4 protein [Parachlamydiales bacterium]|nr:Hydrolase 4 protein [Parachlamydiales bacterium]
MSQELPFDPFPFISDPHRQTILSSLINFFFDPSSEQIVVDLPDSDKLSLEISTPDGWKPTDLTVIMVHGLCGSHRSPYLVRMVKRLKPLGIRTVRLNLRGCGSGKGIAKQMYHSGRSDDIFEAIKVLKAQTPDSPFVLIGFSLGGNIVLKMGGELGAMGKEFLAGLIAISPPVDLYSSVIMLGKPENSIYERYFIRMMRADVHYRHRKFKDLPRIKLPRDMKIRDFDQIYTAPQYGFRNADDYYNKCSAATVISEISVPCKILLAEDDPIISATSLDAFALPKCVDVFKTKQGGHMGYLGNPTDGKGLYWLDALLMDWIVGFN